MALSNVGGHHPIHWAPEIEQKGWRSLDSCSANWAETSIFCSRSSWFSGLQTWTEIYTIGFLTFRPSSYSTGFLGSLACRQPIMGLFNLHNEPILHNKSLCRYTSYWFCFSGESLMHNLSIKVWFVVNSIGIMWELIRNTESQAL